MFLFALAPSLMFIYLNFLISVGLSVNKCSIEIRQMSLKEWPAWFKCSDTCGCAELLVIQDTNNVGVPQGTLSTKGSGGSNKQSQNITSVRNKYKR